MAEQKKEQPNSLRSRVSMALDQLNLLPDDEDLKNKFIGWIRSVIEKDPDLKERYIDGGAPTPFKLLKNIALLKISFSFSHPEIRSLIKNDCLTEHPIKKAISLRQKEVALLSRAYNSAHQRFPKLSDALSTDQPLEDIDLTNMIPSVIPADIYETSTPVIPLHLAKCIEEVRWSDRFQEDDPAAICLVAESYIELGALDISEALIEQAFAQTPEHAGVWFQKSRLLMKKSAKAMQQASHYQLSSEYADPMSAAESHWEEMAMEEASLAQDLRNNAFEACVKSYGLLPDSKNYERSAIEWSHDYGSLRELRHRILIFIVQEAGRLCNPYGSHGELHDRIEARLGRTQKLHLPSMVWSEDPEKMARLAALPLFSETTDIVLVSAYKELMTSHWSVFDKTHLQLLALNFMRLLASDDYPVAVTNFVDRLKMAHASDSGRYLGPFSGFSDEDDAGWRTVLHEHLDAVMIRQEQRELVREVYGKWIAWVSKTRDDTLSSLFDDEIRIRFAKEDKMGAYATACQAEDDGIYRRNEPNTALVLRRMAQWASQAPGAEQPKVDATRLQQHLDDKDMEHLAEEHFDKAYDWNGDPDWMPQIPAALDRWQREADDDESI